MSPLVLAHAGHWLVQLMYAAPLLALVVAVVMGRRREAREEREAAERGEPAEGAPPPSGA